jgi:hypothetical protein
MISKYGYVHELVCQLTDNKSLRTFYTLYLMADSDEERKRINHTFHEASNVLEAEDLLILKKDFTESYKKILPLLKDLNNRVSEMANSLKMQKKAA